MSACTYTPTGNQSRHPKAALPQLLKHQPRGEWEQVPLCSILSQLCRSEPLPLATDVPLPSPFGNFTAARHAFFFLYFFSVLFTGFTTHTCRLHSSAFYLLSYTAIISSSNIPPGRKGEPTSSNSPTQTAQASAFGSWCQRHARLHPSPPWKRMLTAPHPPRTPENSFLPVSKPNVPAARLPL